MKKTLYFFLLSLLLGIGCQPKPLEITIPAAEPEVVVFSQIIPPSVMAVFLSQTFGALEFSQDNGDTLSPDLFDQLLLSQAQVTVNYMGRTDTLFSFDSLPGLYLNPFIPQIPNQQYDLRIETADDRVLTASSLMLRRVPFDTIYPVVEEEQPIRFEYRFADPEEANWYMINYYSNSVPARSDAPPIDSLATDSLDLDALLVGGDNVLLATQLISDALVTNGVYEGEISLPQLATTDTLFAAISNISEAYYQFLSLRSSADNFFTEITREPVNYPTNIQGGKGFFLTHFPDVRVFDLNEW